jgi:hypothetical protein
MINEKNPNDKEKELNKKLDTFLNKKDCEGEDCIIQDPEEIVKRENKKIITNDGRQLLSEYTTR